jgi:FkbM family methyltransferase
MIKLVLRELLRLYLRVFPLRDGKLFLYQGLSERLLPGERYVTARIKPGFRMKLDLAEETQRLLYFYGDYDERHEIAMLGRVLTAGDHFGDIGANIGFYSLSAAKMVGSRGTVVAFEPGASAWQSLLANIELNRLEAVIHPFHLAVAEKKGQATLHCRPGIADGGASLLPREAAGAGKENCATVSLDDFYRESGFPPPTFLKIDVEGLEPQVLQGAREILGGAGPPLLLLEMNAKETLAGILQGLGYQGVCLRRRRWYLTEDISRARSRNMLWFRPDCGLHRERLAKILVRSEEQ